MRGNILAFLLLALMLLAPAVVQGQETYNITVTTDKREYILGETIRVSGVVNSTETLLVNVYFNTTYVSVTAANGSFVAYYKPKLVGNYTIRAEVVGAESTSNTVSVVVRKPTPMESVKMMFGEFMNISIWVLAAFIIVSVAMLIIFAFATGSIKEDDILFLIALIVGVVIAALAFNYFLMA